MENASKALIIAGAILLSILIIAIGIYIFNGANSTIVDSMSSMSTQEVEAFNNQFLTYEGDQSGSNVKSLLGRLTANASTYAAESAKVPAVVGITKSADRPASESEISTYISGINDIRAEINNKTQYHVEFSFKNDGLINTITITKK